jgi:hypothetical protein
VGMVGGGFGGYLDLHEDHEHLEPGQEELQ